MSKTFALLVVLATVTGCARTDTPQPVNMQVSQEQQLQQPSQAQQFQSQLNDYLEAATDECFAKYESGEYKTLVALQICYNHATYKVFVALDAPEDLMNALFKRYIAIAKKVDQKKISLKEASAEDSKAYAQFRKKTQKRWGLAASVPQPQAVSPQPVSAPVNEKPASNPCRSMLLQILKSDASPEAKQQAMQMVMQWNYPQGCP